jgi:hypothetical protein
MTSTIFVTIFITKLTKQKERGAKLLYKQVFATFVFFVPS